jgi:predicted PurR-regulated permease PerM
VVLAAGTIGGVLGMVLAIPSYTILRVIAREFLSEFKVVDSLTRDLADEG